MEVLLIFFYENAAVTVAAIAALISIHANFISRKNMKIANKALEIAERQEEEKDFSVTTYLNQSAIWSDEEFFYFAIFVTFHNKSTQHNSLANPLFILELKSDHSKTLILNCNPCTLSSIPKSWADKKQLDFPLSIAARCSVEGVVYSKLGKNIVEDRFINSIKLKSTDVLGKYVTVISFSPRDENV